MIEIAVPEERAGQDAESASGAAVLDGLDEQLIGRLVGKARAKGVKLAGEGGLLSALTKRLLESVLDRTPCCDGTGTCWPAETLWGSESGICKLARCLG